MNEVKKHVKGGITGNAPGDTASEVNHQGSRPWAALSRLVLTKELGCAAFLMRFAIVFFAVWAVLWAFVSAQPMAFQDRDYPLMRAKEAIAAKCNPAAVVIFGDSRAVAGVDPALMAMPVENLALSGSTPVETYFFLRQRLRCASPPKLVILTHSAVTYTADSEFWRFDARTGFLDAAELRQVARASQALNDDELARASRPSGLPLAWLPTLYALHFPPLYFGSLVNGYVFGRLFYNKRVFSDVQKTGGHALYGSAAGSHNAAVDVAFTDWRASPLISLYFSRSLALLSEHSVPVLLLTMPVNTATCHGIPATLQGRFTHYIIEAVASYRNVIAIDPTIACWPDRFFGDAWHFNHDGAGAYSHRLSRVLTALLPTLSPPYSSTYRANLETLLALQLNDSTLGVPSNE